MSVDTTRAREQAKILRSLAVRFRGDYAWLEKPGMHASEVAIVLTEGSRRVDTLADEVDRLLEKYRDEEESNRYDLEFKWEPLLAAAEAVQLDDDMDSDVNLMNAIAACEEKT